MAAAAPWSPTFPAHLPVYTDSSRTNRIASGAPLTTDATGLDTLWVYGDPSALVDRTDSLSIPVSNRAVVTFTLPPLDLPRAVSAEIHDDDGDGRGDRLQVAYDREITGSLPVSVAYLWPASVAPVSVSDLAPHLRDGNTLVFGGAPLSPAILTGGTGVFSSTYRARAKDSVQRLDVADRIAPVQTVWSPDGLSVRLIFISGVSSAPKAGDLVRKNGGPGLGADALGNMPGPESRLRPIMGEKRLGLQTLSLHRIAPDASLLASPVFVASLEGSGAGIQDAIDRTGRIGVLMEARNRRGRVFVGWNQASMTGQLVGTGAYVVQFSFRIVSQGKVAASNGIRQIWGFLRTQ